jgi:LSD1 subclass zinc finger protein
LEEGEITMKHTFISMTWGGNKPVPKWMTIIFTIVGVLFTISIIGFPVGVFFLILAYSDFIFNMRIICPSCKVKISVVRSAKAVSCYNCQAVFAKKNNQWEIVT